MSTIRTGSATPRGPSRAGFTLRELSIAMALGSTVMMIAVSMVHRALDWSTTAQFRRLDDQTFFQLGRQLRTDVHSASNAAVTDEADGQQLLLTMQDETEIRYELRNQKILRIQTSDDGTVKQEVYRFKQPRQFWLQTLDESGQVEISAKSITPFAAEDVPLWRTLRASTGLRLRHQRGEIES